MSTAEERRDVYNTRDWLRLRDAKLDLNPLCEECAKRELTVPAEIVHHIVPISEGGEPFPDVDGLESLCISCHSKHHNTKHLTDEQQKFYDLMIDLN